MIHRIQENTTCSNYIIMHYHVRKLTRPWHGGTKRRDHHLATALDPYSKDELLTHLSGGNHGDVEASGDDSPFRQGAGAGPQKT